MRIVLASSNKGKIAEFKKLLPNNEVIAYKDIIGEYEVIEDGMTFQENAKKKALEIYEKINDENVIVISDDSGISVPALNGDPGIYSARYAGEPSNAKNNNKKLISELNKLNLEKTPAFYTACIAIVYKKEIYTVHGWMHGDVINEEIGEGGFGYDPMFIPSSYDKTFGELSSELKKSISHRAKAMHLAQKILDVIL